MKKEKLSYSRAELEILLLSAGDIICTSGETDVDPDDMTNIPDDGSWS